MLENLFLLTKKSKKNKTRHIASHHTSINSKQLPKSTSNGQQSAHARRSHLTRPYKNEIFNKMFNQHLCALFFIFYFFLKKFVCAVNNLYLSSRKTRPYILLLRLLNANKIKPKKIKNYTTVSLCYLIKK